MVGGAPSEKNSPDAICKMVADAVAGNNPYTIAIFPNSVLVVSDIQYYRGHCMLLLKRHVRDLHDLPMSEYLEYSRELVLAGKAIADALQPWKLNYQSLGNQVPHLHWHIIPRYEDDPNLKQHPFSELMRGEVTMEDFRTTLSEAASLAREIRKHIREGRN